MVVALLVDIVNSRKLGERRSDAQIAIHDAAERSQRIVTPLRAIWPTSSDEFQATFTGLRDAVVLTMLLRLAMPKGLECRFGIGVGDDLEVRDPAADIRDGTAWYRARRAIERARELEKGDIPAVRTWCRIEEEGSAPLEASINAHLVQRDQIITTMRWKTRQLLFGELEGLTQAEQAARHGITQATVSSNLRRGGPAAVLEAMRLFDEGMRALESNRPAASRLWDR